MTKENKLFAGAFYTFFVNGLTAILVGAIMPFIISDYNIGYDKAGVLLSLFAGGNLSSSFVFPFLAHLLGRKRAIIILSLLTGGSYICIVTTSNYAALMVAFFLLGLGRGSISNTNNAVVNDTATGKSAPLNILHTFFAVGAFASPLLSASLINFGMSWRASVYVIIFFALTMPLVYSVMDIKDYPAKNAGTDTKAPFYKNISFILAGGLLFFYLGAEAAVCGWVVSYLKDAGIMSIGYAQNMLSLLWIVIIFGRLLTAYLSKKYKKASMILFDTIGAMIMFILFLSTQDVRVITLSIILFGFFFAGIYPTTVAAAGKIINGSNAAMAALLAIAGLGGIILPFLTGLLADNIGIAAGMAFIAVAVVFSVVFAVMFKISSLKTL